MPGLSLDQQEKALIEDLLFVLLGFEGQYVTYSSERTRNQEPYDPFDEKSRLSGPKYSIAAGVDLSLRDLAMQILRTATHAVGI